MFSKEKVKEIKRAGKSIQYGMSRPSYGKDVFEECVKVIDMTLKAVLEESGYSENKLQEMIVKFEEIRQQDELLKKCVKDKIFKMVERVGEQHYQKNNPVVDEDTQGASVSSRTGYSHGFQAMYHFYRGVLKWNKKRQ